MSVCVCETHPAHSLLQSTDIQGWSRMPGQMHGQSPQLCAPQCDLSRGVTCPVWKINSFRCGYYIKHTPLLDHSGTNYQSSKIAQAHHLISLSLPERLLIFLCSQTRLVNRRAEEQMLTSVRQLPKTRSAKGRRVWKGGREELETNGMPCHGHFTWPCASCHAHLGVSFKVQGLQTTRPFFMLSFHSEL